MSTRLDGFLEALERAEYEATAGHTDTPVVRAVYDRHADMFTAATFRSVTADATPSIGGTRRAYLRDFVGAGIEGFRTRETEEALLIAEASAAVDVDGEAIPFRSVPIHVRREPDRVRRQALESARLEVVRDTLNPLLLDRLRATHAVAESLLGTTYDRYIETLAGIDFDALESLTDDLLPRTADCYDELFATYVGPVAAADVRTHDVSYALHGAVFADRFPWSGMVDRIGGCMAAMGIDLEAGGRVRLDLDDRPAKSSRAFCSAIRVPEEVMLVVKPHGGYEDYMAFLHELGHALHFANVDVRQPVEFRRLGDNSVTEAFAMTFDHLLHLPQFLKRVLGIGDPEPILRFAGFREAFLLRRYAAKLSYERSLHRSGAGPARAAEYVERLTGATGARPSEISYLDDVDPRFYCVRYLRAWMLTGCMHEVLRDRFDEDWFLNPRTGAFFEELWSLGQGVPAERLAVEYLGGRPLTFEPLIRMLNERVR